MIIYPSNQDLFWGQLDQVREFLALFAQLQEFGTVLQIDALRDNQTHQLPNNSQNQMRLPLNESIVINPRNFAANALRRRNRQVQILLNLIDIYIGLHVDRSEVDGALLDQVDQLAEDDAVA